MAPDANDQRSHEVKLYATYAETDDDALHTVSDMMPDGWRVDRIVGLLSRVEVERLRLSHGEVREVSSFTIGGLFLPEDAEHASNSDKPSMTH
ncbi:hypothetical protein [Methylobacterium sp. WL93]|uniref:hypothetical protein n=1 Tax=Methylobacterium sp. WL93 TaxID=2603892 RepID=UPI001AEF0323|nr:hypothetical protein [Methylobacterium sp. WL93]